MAKKQTDKLTEEVLRASVEALTESVKHLQLQLALKVKESEEFRWHMINLHHRAVNGFSMERALKQVTDLRHFYAETGTVREVYQDPDLRPIADHNWQMRSNYLRRQLGEDVFERSVVCPSCGGLAEYYVSVSRQWLPCVNCGVKINL